MPGGVSAQGGLPKGVCLSRVVCLPKVGVCLGGVSA